MREEFAFMDEIVSELTSIPTEYKYVEVEVSKSSWSVIYLKVPKHYDWKDIIKKGEHCIRKEGDAVDRSDWDDTGTEYDVHSIKEVPEKEASMFGYSQVD